MINSPEGWFQRLIFRSADKSYVSLSFSVVRGHSFMSWLPLSLGDLATVFVLFTLWHISHMCVYPANISANGFDNGVARASPIIIRHFSYLELIAPFFFSFFSFDRLVWDLSRQCAVYILMISWPQTQSESDYSRVAFGVRSLQVFSRIFVIVPVVTCTRELQFHVRWTVKCRTLF